MPSSVMEWMMYEPERQALLIGFRGGRGVYRYFDVAAEEWAAFLQARSKGDYLNREFKQQGHRFERVEKDPARPKGHRVNAEGPAHRVERWPRERGVERTPEGPGPEDGAEPSG